MMATPLLQIEGLVKSYPIRGGILSRKQGEVQAVRGVSLDLMPGETLGLVGESGCGKSTLARTLMRLEPATAGSVRFQGVDLLNCDSGKLFQLRRDIQMIFQDPYSSLNPRLPVGETVREPLDIHRIGKSHERRGRVAEIFASVGLAEEMMDRYPHEFSGGQRQRVGIARALALHPKIIVADEPVSALDVSVQAQVINLLVALQKRMGLTYIFISHDLSVVEYISDRIAIMYLGRIVEEGLKQSIFSRPAHPYTRALLEAAPSRDPERRREKPPVRGETPSPIHIPSGCPFHVRCPHVIDECRHVVPELEGAGTPGDAMHRAACIRKGEI